MGATVLHTTLRDWPGALTVVAAAEHGWLWVFASSHLDISAAQTVASSLCAVIERIGSPATDPELFELLHRTTPLYDPGSPGRVAVVRATPAVPAVALDRALRRHLSPEASSQVTVTRELAYVVVRRAAAEEQILARLDALLTRAGAEVRSSLAGVLSPPGLSLEVAREQAEQALKARAVIGRCVRAVDCRAHVVLPHLLEQLRAPLVQTPDPVRRLADEDPKLAASLLAWLDHHGQTSEAAVRLDVHPNTLRYRIARAMERLGVDLNDPVTRVVTHLQLMGETTVDA